MPHLTLEYSANVERPADMADLFERLHQVLATTGRVRIANCKSRARACADFRVGAGGDRDAFVHLDIRLLEGRPTDLKLALATEAHGVLMEVFSASVNALDLQVTVEVRDIGRATYVKYPEGTLGPR